MVGNAAAGMEAGQPRGETSVASGNICIETTLRSRHYNALHPNNYFPALRSGGDTFPSFAIEGTQTSRTHGLHYGFSKVFP
mmetsp:Transcript_140792/g.245279  ORF Transcript_140792/g.245279 Transcript_140792/m.245279 type:complete len:81 (-) Transcript_140792:180-422(-)